MSQSHKTFLLIHAAENNKKSYYLRKAPIRNIGAVLRLLCVVFPSILRVQNHTKKLEQGLLKGRA
ncbi:MAG: hypothetical protein OXC40_01365 [Proteobacteria bacterium]|nr:hypothetical protein [Pseudomonadota bacterium]